MSAVQSIAQDATTLASTRQAPLYPFLSLPPPQKTRPSKPLPPAPTEAPESPMKPPFIRRRSATIAAIASWAADVLPGTPAPWSPRRSPSARRSSLSRSVPRRVSGSSAKAVPASFFHDDTPTSVHAPVITPCMKDFRPDLTTVGYTSVFIHFPQTPLSPPVVYGRVPSSRVVPASPTSTIKTGSLPRGLKQFKSLTALRAVKAMRLRTPSSPAPASADHKRSHAPHGTAVIKKKKSKYAKLLPAPLANDLALAQLVNGGSLDDQVRRFAEAEAKAAGAKKTNGQLVGVGDVYRDEHGGIWADRDEEWEFAHLLGGVEDVYNDKQGWVQFTAEPDTERRESVSTQDSDLNPQYAMQVEADFHDDLASFSTVIATTTRVKPGLSVLAIPARSRRAAKHLRKPEFLLNVFPIPHSPSSKSSPLSPRSPRLASHHFSTRTKGNARRRPAPLKLTPPGPASKLPLNPADVDQMRKEFLDDSFAPRAGPLDAGTGAVDVGTSTAVLNQTVSTLRPTTTTKKGFFRSIGGKKADGSLRLA